MNPWSFCFYILIPKLFCRMTLYSQPFAVVLGGSWPGPPYLPEASVSRSSPAWTCWAWTGRADPLGRRGTCQVHVLRGRLGPRVRLLGGPALLTPIARGRIWKGGRVWGRGASTQPCQSLTGTFRKVSSFLSLKDPLVLEA